MSVGPTVPRATRQSLAIFGNCYPADEQRISEIERGLSNRAVLPMPHGRTLSAGDSVLFELASSHSGRETRCVQGDSVRVLLTDVADLGTTDSATGRPLFQLSWEPLGQGVPTDFLPKRPAKPRLSLR